MQSKRYEARSANEALKKIKADLGSDAIVLSSKRHNGKFEVVAARDDNYEISNKSDVEKEGFDTLSIIRSEVNALKSFITDLKEERGVHAELMEIKETMNVLFDVLGVQRNESVSSSLSPIYYHLISVGISKERALVLIDKLKKDGFVAEPENYYHGLRAVEDVIRRSVASCYKDSGKKRISAFIGPAGEGKTTTLAKLAARCLFEEKLNVGIITMDTYRIGATKQLKTYSDIMDIPVEIASEKEGFEKALSRFSNKDVILVDTPGKSRGDKNYLLKLKECLGTDTSLGTNLVLSLTSSRESIMDAVKRFGIIDYSSILFTKLDDSRKFGSIYNVMDYTGKPVFYVTDGQNVPKDLKKMDPAKLARLIVGQESGGNGGGSGRSVERNESRCDALVK
jgi:flagellar biosynthesis protein FlhF